VLHPRTVLALGVVLGAAYLLASCATSKGLPEGPDAVWHLVVIGDSSLWGLGDALAERIRIDRSVDVRIHDYTMGGQEAAPVRNALQGGESASLDLERLPGIIREAEYVIIFANPLGSVDPEHPLEIEGCFGRRPPGNCDEEAFARWEADLSAIWGEILRLRSGQATILRATDIYNPVISRWREAGTLEACTACWEQQSAAARRAAVAHGIPFLSRYDAFNGVSHDEDPREKGYILSDGEHPTDLANAYTAELLAQMGYEPTAAR
jgi:hypothetical protein